MEDEWEEEEQLVVVELSGVIDNDFVSKCSNGCKILDVDSEKPMMQIGQYVFVGEYEDAMGTCVIFEEGPPNKEKIDLKYKCHTVKRLKMQRIFLTEKKEGETSSGGTTSSQDSEDACHQAEAGDQKNKSDYEDMAVG